jgi:hypothetical protein
MITMIAEDVAAVAVIALFVWLVPMRRHGIPGLRGRGRAPVSPLMADLADPAASGDTSGVAGMYPRPVPADERITAASGGTIEVLAEHGGRRGAGRPAWGPAQAPGHHQHSA